MNNKEYQKQYHITNKKKLLNYLKKWRKQHKKEIQEYTKNYRKFNKIKVNEATRKWRLTHKKETNQQHKNYCIKNKKRISEWRKTYTLNKRKNNIHYRIRLNLSIRLWQALKGICKSNTTIKLLGCSIEFFKNYLKLNFAPGMSFSNYGKWHIDHIRPCASFDLSKPSEQSKCFHYTNLQPLWAKDNFKKNDKYEIE